MSDASTTSGTYLWVRLLLLSLSTVLLPSSVTSLEVVLKDDVGFYSLSSVIEVYENSEEQISLERLLNTEKVRQFQRKANLGTGHSAWARFVLTNTATREDWILEVALTYHETLILFTQDEDGWSAQHSGSLMPFNDRPFKHRNYAFRVSVPIGESRTVYLRTEYVDRGNLAFPVRLWTPEAFADSERHGRFILGAFYGLMAVMALYNLFLYASLRDRAYLNYVFLLMTATLMFAFQNGLASEYLWPTVGLGWGLPDLICLGLFYIACTAFVQSFLLTKEQAKIAHKALWGVVFVWGVLILLGLAGYPGLLRPHAIFSALSLGIFLFAGIVVLRQGFRPARYFLIGWTSPAAAGILLNLGDIEILPSDVASIYHAQIGMAAALVLFSLGLADRINLITREKDEQAFAAREANLRARTAEVERLTMEKELSTAHEMQMSLMPKEGLQRDGVDMAGRCLPATQVGGDLFHYINTEDRLGVCLADVTGHGMEAAIPVVRFSGILESELASHRDLAELYDSLNRMVTPTTTSRQFVCFSAAELDIGTRTLEIGNAGCPYAYFYQGRKGSLEEIMIEAYPIGIRADTDYLTIRVSVEAGDRLILCSDGIPEAIDENDDQMGYDRMTEIVEIACQGEKSSSDVVNEIIEETMRFGASQLSLLPPAVIHADIFYYRFHS